MVACFLMVEKKSKEQDLMIHKNYTKFTFQLPPESFVGAWPRPLVQVLSLVASTLGGHG